MTDCTLSFFLKHIYAPESLNLALIQHLSTANLSVFSAKLMLGTSIEEVEINNFELIY